MPRQQRSERKRQSGQITQPAFQHYCNPLPPLEIISKDQLEMIHYTSLRVLKELGIKFLLPEAVSILRQAGAEVDTDDQTVRFPPELIEQSISTVPTLIACAARNPKHNFFIGNNYFSVASVGSPPNIHDRQRGRIAGNMDDYCDLLKLMQSLNICHQLGGHVVEPTDLAPNVRHLISGRAMLRYTDKVAYGYSLGRKRILDSLEMCRIAHGVSPDEFHEKARIFSVVNANSPRQYDSPMLWGMIEMAKQRQPVKITPFTLAGAMAPITIIGALVQQNAEALAGIAFMQIVNPGCPVIYGGFTSNVDMKSGAPAFGTPEYAQAVVIGGQLARRYGFPYRSSNVNASNAVDEQSTYESAMSIWATALSHCNVLHHGLGWLEGGLSASYEKVIIDAEMIQHVMQFLKPLPVDLESLAYDSIKEVNPGGHYFSTAHTMERFTDAFYTPILSDWQNFENWQERGGVKTADRAYKIARKIIADYEMPPMDPSIAEALDDFVERRVSEGGAAAED